MTTGVPSAGAKSIKDRKSMTSLAARQTGNVDTCFVINEGTKVNKDRTLALKPKKKTELKKVYYGRVFMQHFERPPNADRSNIELATG